MQAAIEQTVSALEPEALQLPYGFAKRFGVFLHRQQDVGLTLCFCESLAPEVLVEVRRFCGEAFVCERIARADFDAALSKCYESVSGDARRSGRPGR